MSQRVLYFECKTGAAGDMLMGALFGLLTKEQKALFIEKVNSISKEITVAAEEKIVNGIGGIHMRICVRGEEEHEHWHELDHEHHGHAHNHNHDNDHEHHHHDHDHGHHHHDHDHEHHHHGHHHEHHHKHHHNHISYQSVLEQIRSLDVSEQVRKHAEDVYTLIGAAESKVHCTTMEQIHFHEVGTLDALMDVVGCCLIIDMLEVNHILASPVCVGNGTVRCAHGILPVPAPATAEIIKGMPINMSSFDGELLTPTGAAILKHFVSDYKKDVDMVIEEIGYGMGTKTFDQPTFVRVFLGNTCS